MEAPEARAPARDEQGERDEAGAREREDGLDPRRALHAQPAGREERGEDERERGARGDDRTAGPVRPRADRAHARPRARPKAAAGERGHGG